MCASSSLSALSQHLPQQSLRGAPEEAPKARGTTRQCTCVAKSPLSRTALTPAFGNASVRVIGWLMLGLAFEKVRDRGEV